MLLNKINRYTIRKTKVDINIGLICYIDEKPKNDLDVSCTLKKTDRKENTTVFKHETYMGDHRQ